MLNCRAYNKSIIRGLFMIACFFQFVPSQAYSVRRYNERDGLSENSVLDAIQDSRGYIWACTRNGLNRFDGYEFVHYGADEDTYRFESLCEHQDHLHIWATSTGALYLFDLRTEKFQPFSEVTSKGKEAKNIKDLCYGPDGNLYMAGEEGLYIWDGSKLDFLECPGGNAVLETSDGMIWLCAERTLYTYNSERRRLVQMCTLDVNACDVTANPVTAFKEGIDGRLWIGTWRGDLVWYDSRSGEQKILIDGSQRISSSASVDRIHDIFDNSPLDLFLCSDSGLIICDKISGKCRTFELDKSSDSFYKMLRDHEGGLWLPTYFSGIEYLSPDWDGMECYVELRGENSLKGSAVRAFQEDKDGTLWVATENGGLNKFDPASGTFTDYSAKSHYNIQSLFLDGDNLWIGTFSHGLDRMDVRTGKVVNYRNRSGDASSLVDDHVYHIRRYNSDELLIATLHGFCSYHESSNTFVPVEEMGHQFYANIEIDDKRNVWVSSKSDGIWMRSVDDMRWHHWHSSLSGDYHIPSNRINSIHCDADGKIWALTENKGILLKKEGEAFFTQISSNEGLPSATYYCLLEGDEGVMWLSSNKGLVEYDSVAKTSRSLTFDSGLQGNLFSINAAMKAKDGKLYFGGTNGFNSFYPDKLKHNKVQPQVSVPIVVAHHKNGVSEIRFPSNSISLPRYTSSVDISFRALSYVSPSQVQYAWKYGKDDWVVTKQNNVSLTGLKPGHHTFSVKACNNDGLWNDEALSLDMVIKAPAMLSVPAILSYFALSILLVLLVIRFMKEQSRMKEEAEKKERELAMEQKSLSDKLEFFSNVAHEIKTPVTLIKVPLEQVIVSGKWDAETEENLSIIHKNTNRLQELVRQLLDFRKADSDMFPISKAPVNVGALVQDMVCRFSPVDGRISISSELPKTPVVCETDQEALTKILSNLLMNALKYADSSIRISVSISDSMMIEVRDDGPGIPEDVSGDLFQPFFQVVPGSGSGFGIGLSLVKLLTEKLGGTVSIGNVPDGRGCLAVVRLPYIPSVISNEVPDLENADGPLMLIVDDIPDMCMLLRKIFREEFRILTAADGNEALSILRGNDVDVVISDLMMPGMDGLELLQAMRSTEYLADVPVIILTARDSQDSRLRVLENGAAAYVEKPFSEAELTAVVHNAVSNRAPSEPVHDTSWMSQVDDIVKKNIGNPLFSVDILSDKLAMSRSSLQRKFRECTGLSPADYVKRYRLRTAARLLRNGQYRVGEVAYMTGFTDPSYFSRCFQTEFGILPKDYQKTKK